MSGGVFSRIALTKLEFYSTINLLWITIKSVLFYAANEKRKVDIHGTIRTKRNQRKISCIFCVQGAFENA